MSSILLARTGRHLQLYNNKLRLVAGCIPYKLRPSDGDEKVDLISRLEVLMISSPNRHDLVFPKGGWEKDETVREAACRETLEEAGVRGNIHDTVLGKWQFRSKSRQDSCDNEGTCEGFMFAMEVTEELEYWPEQSTHKRRWLTVVDALRLCRYDWMREALAECVNFLSEKFQLPCSNYHIVKQPASERAVDVSEPLASCFVNPTTPERPASCFVNPTTPERAINAYC